MKPIKKTGESCYHCKKVVGINIGHVLPVKKFNNDSVDYYCSSCFRPYYIYYQAQVEAYSHSNKIKNNTLRLKSELHLSKDIVQEIEKLQLGSFNDALETIISNYVNNFSVEKRSVNE